MPEIKNLQKTEPDTFETVLASLKETGRLFKETREEMKETDRRFREIEQRFKETERFIKETSEQMKDTDRRMKELQKTVGGWSNSHGDFAEEYFFNSFENKQQNFFGEHFNEIEKNVKPVKQIGKKEYLKDEYDIVMYNDSYVAIVETKFKVRSNDIPKVLKKAETFRILCPDFIDYKIYLGLASLSFFPELEQECINQGIAIIKQVGDSVVINDAHLKVF